MKTKGAIPISYIVALLLGIAVIGIIGYWFFFLGGEIGGEVTLNTCRSRAYTYCASWQAIGYSKDSSTCEPDIVGWFSESYQRCISHEDDLGFRTSCPGNQDACKIILGTADIGGGIEGDQTATTTQTQTTSGGTLPF